jgi:hypothetical protein
LPLKDFRLQQLLQPREIGPVIVSGFQLPPFLCYQVFYELIVRGSKNLIDYSFECECLQAEVDGIFELPNCL